MAFHCRAESGSSLHAGWEVTSFTHLQCLFRYSLPQVIRFLDNEIQEIYTRNLIEGVEQMTNVTGEYVFL